MLKITSAQNGKFKELKNLVDAKHRNASKQFLIEGSRFVREALPYEDHLLSLILAESFLGQMPIEFSSVPQNKWIVLSDSLLNNLSETKTPQGIMAVMKQKEYSFDPLFDKGSILWFWITSKTLAIWGPLFVPVTVLV
jgi:RNA methyltransferase, TrmH family